MTMKNVPGRSPLALLLALAGCAAPQPLDTHRLIPGPHAAIRDAHGNLVARATSTIVVGGLRWRIDGVALRPGTYGLHIHQTGRCDLPDFTGAGPHWNPTGRRHGRHNPQGPHFGDLSNMVVDANGRGVIEAVIGGDPMDGDGAAVVIHANPDDERTDPSGNSGARIACGVLSY
jgi:superoxide dismutase, Cu-Zn family